MIALLAPEAKAADTVTLYRGSCKINTGLIAKINSTSIYFLNLTGEVTVIPRYDVVGIAIYSIPNPSINRLKLPKGVELPFYEFTTFRNGAVEHLATGWPIEYNKTNIQLLTDKSTDILIRRDEIWGVKKLVSSPKFAIKTVNQSKQKYTLENPLLFASCKKVQLNHDSTTVDVKVIPIESYTNPISIKKYQDRLKEGLDQIDDYDDRQRFYAVPQYFKNQTRLGSWFVVNSRYSNVGARQGNFLPLVQDELSEGPFGFQRIVRSGLFPIEWTSQAEANVQVFYGLKADYIALELFLDPTRPLIGDKYRWKKSDLEKIEDRPIESGGGKFGFDFGYASLSFVITGGELGIRANDFFENISYSTTQLALSTRYNYFVATLYIGSDTLSSYNDVKLDQTLQNLVLSFPLSPLNLTLSYISRSNRGQLSETAEYHSHNRTLSTFVTYTYNHRWDIYLQPIVEKVDSEFSSNSENRKSDKTYFSLSGGASVSF